MRGKQKKKVLVLVKISREIDLPEKAELFCPDRACHKVLLSLCVKWK